MPKGNGSGQGGGNDTRKAHYLSFKDSGKSVLRVRSSAEVRADNVIGKIDGKVELKSDGLAVNGWFAVTLPDGREGFVSAEVVELKTTTPVAKAARKRELVAQIKAAAEQIMTAVVELVALMD